MTTITDDELLRIWRSVKPSTKQDKAMVYQSGQYDIDKPTLALRDFAEAMIRYAQEEVL